MFCSLASVTLHRVRVRLTLTLIRYYWPAYTQGSGDSFVLLSGVCNTPRQRICNVTHQEAARDGGPVVLSQVRVILCLGDPTFSHFGL